MPNRRPGLPSAPRARRRDPLARLPHLCASPSPAAATPLPPRPSLPPIRAAPSSSAPGCTLTPSPPPRCHLPAPTLAPPPSATGSTIPSPNMQDSPSTHCRSLHALLGGGAGTHTCSPRGAQRRLVKALLADPAAPDLEIAATAGGNTLLHLAEDGGHAALLLRRGPRLLAARNSALDTPLHHAARAGAHKVVAALVTSSSSTSSLCALTRATNRRGETALHDAVRAGHEAAARALAAADPGLAWLCGGAGESPIYMAAAAGSLGIVRVLIKT